MARVLEIALNLYLWLILIRVITSWVDADRRNPIVGFVVSATEPILKPIRQALGSSTGRIDFSPAVVIVVIMVLERLLT